MNDVKAALLKENKKEIEKYNFIVYGDDYM